MALAHGVHIILISFQKRELILQHWWALLRLIRFFVAVWVVYVDGAMIQRIGQNQRRGMEPDVDDFPLDEEHPRMNHDDYDDDIRLLEEHVNNIRLVEEQINNIRLVEEQVKLYCQIPPISKLDNSLNNLKNCE